MKVASTVRRGAVGKMPKGNSLAAYPAMEQFTARSGLDGATGDLRMLLGEFTFLNRGQTRFFQH